MSRLNDSFEKSTCLDSETNVAEEYVRFVAEQDALCAIPIGVIEKASDTDADLEKIRQAVKSGNWNQCCTSLKAVKDEITTVGRIVLRGTRIIIPKRRDDTEAKSGETENDVFWPCDACGRHGKGDDAGVWGGKTTKRTTKKEMDGGDTRDNEDESSGTERGDERSERMEKAYYGSR